mmetsp:Transcript_27705/g.54385  ORF Transcript_27705/g.54385 Transcript_27705/m.54385 type:complete len:190 (+) Transcript_27705:83-652(+)|eukprot:CAMPEP_0172881820 /NCGR_PEP_ID=MMETSP1075-20121228/118502_1 /TAXON_ID=2916 /ORGANISM="Ceratium fusus, Strain PA161109" /LENGTH=189 /DNA_ID=CAMNT_0013734365 /DNA_START=24 /DNA_END=593 /DNA_ORIENTATION=+
MRGSQPALMKMVLLTLMLLETQCSDELTYDRLKQDVRTLQLLKHECNDLKKQAMNVNEDIKASTYFGSTLCIRHPWEKDSVGTCETKATSLERQIDDVKQRWRRVGLQSTGSGAEGLGALLLLGAAEALAGPVGIGLGIASWLYSINDRHDSNEALQELAQQDEYARSCIKQLKDDLSKTRHALKQCWR